MSGRYSPADGGPARSESYQDYPPAHDQAPPYGNYDAQKQPADTDGARDDRDRDYNRDIPRGPRFVGPGRSSLPPRGRGMRGSGRGYHRDFRDGYPPRDRDERDFEYERGRSPIRAGRSPTREPEFRRVSRDGPSPTAPPEQVSASAFRGGRGGRGWHDWPPAGRGRPVEDRDRDWGRPRSRSRERRWERETARSREDREERLRVEREEREREAAQWKQQKRQQDGKGGNWSNPTTPHYPMTTSPRVENRIREFPERRVSVSGSAGPRERERSDYFGGANERNSRTVSPPPHASPVIGAGAINQRSTSGGSRRAPSPNLSQPPAGSAPKPVPTGPRGLGIQPPTWPRSDRPDRSDRVPAAPKSTSSLERSPVSTGPDLNSPPSTFPRPGESSQYPNRSPQSHFSRPVADRKPAADASLHRASSTSSLVEPNSLAGLNVPTGPRADREGRGKGGWRGTATSVPRGLPIKRDYNGMEIDQLDRNGSDTQSWSGRPEPSTEAVEVKREAAPEDVDMGEAVPAPDTSDAPKEPQSKSLLSQLAISGAAEDTMDEDDDVEVEDFEANDKKLSEELDALKSKCEQLKEEKRARARLLERLEEHLTTFVEVEVEDALMEEAKPDERQTLEEVNPEVLRDVTNRVKTPPLTDLPFLTVGRKDLCQENVLENDDTRHHVAEAIRLQRQKTAYKHQRLTEEYERMYKPWIRHAHQLDDLARRPSEGDAAINGDAVVPPILTPTIEGGRRANRGNYISSELVFEQVLRESAAQEEQQRLEREARAKADSRPDYAKEAVVPDMINDEVDVLTSKFRDTNLRLDDAKTIREHFGYQPPKDNFTAEEQAVFIKNFMLFPKKWGKIAQDIENRTYKDCIHHYYLTKHQARYKQTLNSRGRRRTGRRPRNGAGPKSNALMADLGIAPDLYNGDEFEQPSAVSETGRPRRAAAPTFGEAKNNNDDSEGGRKVASTPKDDTDNPMEKVKRTRAKQQRKPRNQPAAAAPAPSPQKPEKPKDRDIIITNTPPPEYVETHVPPPDIPQPRPVQETHVPPPVLVPKPVGSVRDEKENNSYWSGAEMNDFTELLGYFGSDFNSIAHYMSKKSTKMVHNWYKKNVDKPNLRFQEIVNKAEDRIRRDGGPHGIQFPALLDPTAKKKFELSMANGNGRPIIPDVSESRPLAAAPAQPAAQSSGARLQTLAPTHEQPTYQPVSQTARQQPLAQKAPSAAGPQRGFFSSSPAPAIQTAQPSYAPAPQIRNTLRHESRESYNVAMQATPAQQQQMQEEQAGSRDAQRSQPPVHDYRRNTYERPPQQREQYETHEQGRYTPQGPPPPKQQLPSGSHGYQPMAAQSHVYDPLGRTSSASSPPAARPVYNPEPAPYLQQQQQQQQHMGMDRNSQPPGQMQASAAQPVSHPPPAQAAQPKPPNPPRKSMNINALLNSEPEEPIHRYGSASSATATPPPSSTPHRPPPPAMEVPKHEPPAYRPSYGGYELSHSSRPPSSLSAMPPRNSYQPSGPPSQPPPSGYGGYPYSSEAAQPHSQPPPQIHHYSDRGSLPPQHQQSAQQQQQQQQQQPGPPSRYNPYSHTPQHIPSHSHSSHSHAQSMPPHSHYPHSQAPPPHSVYGTRTPSQEQQQQGPGYRLPPPAPGSYDDQK